MMQVNREKRKPSKTPNSVRMKTSGPGRKASHSREGRRGVTGGEGVTGEGV